MAFENGKNSKKKAFLFRSQSRKRQNPQKNLLSVRDSISFCCGIGIHQHPCADILGESPMILSFVASSRKSFFGGSTLLRHFCWQALSLVSKWFLHPATGAGGVNVLSVLS
jgi:hypothetical protein